MIKPTEVFLYLVGAVVALGMIGVAFEAVRNQPTPEDVERLSQPIAIVEEDEFIDEEDDEEVAPQGDEKKKRRVLFPRLRRILPFSRRIQFKSTGVDS